MLLHTGREVAHQRQLAVRVPRQREIRECHRFTGAIALPEGRSVYQKASRRLFEAGKLRRAVLLDIGSSPMVFIKNRDSDLAGYGLDSYPTL